MALCVSMLILGGRVQAAEINIYENTGTIGTSCRKKGKFRMFVFDSRSGIHKGLDIAGEYQSAVYAVEGGWKKSFGHTILHHMECYFIHHDNGFETVMLICKIGW